MIPAQHRRLSVLAAVATLAAALFGSGAAAAGPSEQPDIVGDNVTAAPQGKYPFAVSLKDYGSGVPNQHFCGGALVAPTWVLTAAHCVTGGWTADAVAVNRADLTGGAGEEIAVIDEIVHPSFNSGPGFNPNDIALLELAGPSSATPVTLGSASNAGLWPVGAISTVMGYGATNTANSSDVLLEVDVPIRSDPFCSDQHGAEFFVGSTMLCAGDTAGADDSCQGDSGGPLVVPDGAGEYIGIGLVSWGSGPCGSTAGVYTEVAAFESWVNSIIGGGGSEPSVHVSDVSMVLKTGSDRATGRAVVVDEFDNPVLGAEVTLQWEVDGQGQPAQVDDTNANGKAVAQLNNPPPGATLEVCVLDVSYPGHVYDPSLDTPLPPCALDQWPGGGGGPAMHVDAVTLFHQNALDREVAKVTVRDENGAAVGGADVSAIWTVDGVDQPVQQDDTNSSGKAVFHLPTAPPGAALQLCVTDITHSSFSYDEQGNVVTCGTSTWPGGSGGGNDDELHVAGITIILRPEKNRAIARVTVRDGTGATEATVAVTGEWFINENTQGTQTKNTNGNGKASINLIGPSPGELVFCVNLVEKAGFSYDPIANVETCDTAIWSG